MAIKQIKKQKSNKTHNELVLHPIYYSKITSKSKRGPKTSHDSHKRKKQHQQFSARKIARKISNSNFEKRSAKNNKTHRGIYRSDILCTEPNSQKTPGRNSEKPAQTANAGPVKRNRPLSAILQLWLKSRKSVFKIKNIF